MRHLPGTVTTELHRIEAGADVMFERCPECHGDVTAFVHFEHLLKADYDRALVIYPWSEVNRMHYVMYSYTLEPCEHELLVPTGEPVCTMQATVKRHGARPSTVHPPYLVEWNEHAQRRRQSA
jgi:hypothetical protein